jgi:hypothetical protein
VAVQPTLVFLLCLLPHKESVLSLNELLNHFGAYLLVLHDQLPWPGSLLFIGHSTYYVVLILGSRTTANHDWKPCEGIVKNPF